MLSHAQENGYRSQVWVTDMKMLTPWCQKRVYTSSCGWLQCKLICFMVAVGTAPLSPKHHARLNKRYTIIYSYWDIRSWTKISGSNLIYCNYTGNTGISRLIEGTILSDNTPDVWVLLFIWIFHQENYRPKKARVHFLSVLFCFISKKKKKLCCLSKMKN